MKGDEICDFQSWGGPTLPPEKSRFVRSPRFTILDAPKSKSRRFCHLVNGLLSPPLLPKERGIKGVRLINNLFPLPRGREASPLFEGA
jgi:hypothetical protein